MEVFLMPMVTVKMIEGRTQDQKRAVVKKVTEAICEATGAPPESVSVQLVDLKKDSFGRAGVLEADK